MKKVKAGLSYTVIIFSLLACCSCSENLKKSLNSTSSFKERADTVFEGIKEKDTDMVIDLFCTKIKNQYNLSSEFEGLYDYIDGNIIGSYSYLATAEEESFREGESVYLSGSTKIQDIMTDTGKEYYIAINDNLIFKDHEEYEGIDCLEIVEVVDDSDEYYNTKDPYVIGKETSKNID